jgi:hypothetical protein
MQPQALPELRGHGALLAGEFGHGLAGERRPDRAEGRAGPRQGGAVDHLERGGGGCHPDLRRRSRLHLEAEQLRLDLLRAVAHQPRQTVQLLAGERPAPLLEGHDHRPPEPGELGQLRLGLVLGRPQLGQGSAVQRRGDPPRHTSPS